MEVDLVYKLISLCAKFKSIGRIRIFFFSIMEYPIRLELRSTNQQNRIRKVISDCEIIFGTFLEN